VTSTDAFDSPPERKHPNLQQVSPTASASSLQKQQQQIEEIKKRMFESIISTALKEETQKLHIEGNCVSSRSNSRMDDVKEVCGLWILGSIFYTIIL
jgi:type II secretory ATPase GspE/PulE/Tfp pilus assembly ATPase PilB-like protein